MWRSDRDHLCGMVPAVQADMPETEDFLQSAFGDTLPDWFRSQLARQLAGQEPCPLGTIVQCSALHAKRGVVLLGDSAHAVTSTLGQGCNMALESAVALQHLLHRSIVKDQIPLADVPAAFTEARAHDVWAMQRMEFLSAVLQQNAPADFATAVHARVALGSTFLLNVVQWKMMPKHFTTLPIFSKLYDQQTPYADVLSYINTIAMHAYVAIGVVAASCAMLVANAF